MGAEELPARLWRRRYMRILARRRHRREAAEIRDLIRVPVHPAHERWLRYRAFGGHRCRPYIVVPDGAFTRGPSADIVIIDDPARIGEVPPEMRAAVGEWWADVKRRAGQP